MSAPRGIYTGKVGARMKPRTLRGWSRHVARRSVACDGGPFAGRKLSLSKGDPRTMVFAVGRHVGHYSNGTWVAA